MSPTFTYEELHGLLRAVEIVDRHDQHLLPEARAFGPGVADSLYTKVYSALEAPNPTTLNEGASA